MDQAAAGPTNRQIYKVALASIVGSVIEQFDFLVTGVIAATVWGGVFFKLPAVAAVAAAIGVYGIGIIIRPIGAYIFGNIADRQGRRDALVYALVLMGVSTLLIGLTPTYDSIGIAAPILLIVFRLAQGISFGAEFGTASTWVVEQAARSKYRAFWGAWVGFAIPIGLLLGFGSVIFTKSLMTPEHFTAWGWRILFVVGFLVAIVGLIIRTRTQDSFVFERHKAQTAVLAYPAAQVWHDMPLTILRTSLVNAMFGGAFFLYFVFGTAYMKTVGFIGSTPEIIGPDRRSLHAGVHDHRFAARRHYQPADDPVDRRGRLPGLCHPVFLPDQHRQLPAGDHRRDYRIRLRVRLRLWRNPDFLHGEFPDPLSRFGRKRGLSNRANLRRRTDPDSRRRNIARLWYSRGLYLYRRSGDVYAVLAILAILITPETKGADLEAEGGAPA